MFTKMIAEKQREMAAEEGKSKPEERKPRKSIRSTNSAVSKSDALH